MTSDNPARAGRTAGGPTYQEGLRTVGLTLEASDVRRAALTVDRDGVRVQTTSAWGTRAFTWPDLAIQARALQAQRRPQRPTYGADPWALARWSVLLRGAGALLDGIRPVACELHVAISADGTPDGVVVRALAAGADLFSQPDIAEHLLRLRMRHDRSTYPEAPPPPKRRWWPFGHSD